MADMDMGGNTAAVFRLTVERVERLIEERKGINDDIKDVKAEAKGQGINPKMIDYAVKMRAMERDNRLALLAEQEVALAVLGLV